MAHVVWKHVRTVYTYVAVNESEVGTGPHVFPSLPSPLLPLHPIQGGWCFSVPRSRYVPYGPFLGPFCHNSSAVLPRGYQYNPKMWYLKKKERTHVCNVGNEWVMLSGSDGDAVCQRAATAAVGWGERERDWTDSEIVQVAYR